jgi:hypothetical protein
MNRLSIEQSLRQVADMLLLNGTLTECPGLVHGKMGIAVFFFHYAQYTGNVLFEDYALNLIGKMQEQIHVNSPADYEKGIAGIGVGLIYLIQNNFLDADDDIFDDFDPRMYRAVMYDPWFDFTRYDGLTGYGRYWIMRFPSMQARECLLRIAKHIEERFSIISIKEQTDVYCFLHDLYKISGFEICDKLLDQCRKWDLSSVDFPRLGNSAISNIVRLFKNSHYFNDVLPLQGEIDVALKQIPDLDMEKPPASMGLLTGYAGEGMMRLTALSQTDKSWMHLL